VKPFTATYKTRRASAKRDAIALRFNSVLTRALVVSTANVPFAAAAWRCAAVTTVRLALEDYTLHGGRSSRNRAAVAARAK
jgi:hypothetical protein